MKSTGTSRPYPASRLTREPDIWGQMDVRGNIKNLKKKSLIFCGTCPTILFPQRIATAWGSFSFSFSLRQTRESSPIIGTQMLMFSWFPRRCEGPSPQIRIDKNGKVIVRKMVFNEVLILKASCQKPVRPVGPVL